MNITRDQIDEAFYSLMDAVENNIADPEDVEFLENIMYDLQNLFSEREKKRHLNITNWN